MGVGIGGDGAAPGTEGDIGMSPGTAGNLGIDASGSDLGVTGAPEGGVTGPESKGGQGGAPAYIQPVVAAAATTPVKKEPQQEKKAAVKQKAKRRSLLSSDETSESQVYRRSILGR